MMAAGTKQTLDILQLVIDQVPSLNSGVNQTLDILQLVPSLNSGANQTLDMLQLVVEQVPSPN